MILTYPLDVIRARLAFQVAGEILYTGVFDAFRVMMTQEGGFRALYKGIVPTMIGMAPYAGLSISTSLSNCNIVARSLHPALLDFGKS